MHGTSCHSFMVILSPIHYSKTLSLFCPRFYTSYITKLKNISMKIRTPSSKPPTWTPSQTSSPLIIFPPLTHHLLSNSINTSSFLNPWKEKREEEEEENGRDCVLWCRNNCTTREWKEVLDVGVWCNISLSKKACWNWELLHTHPAGRLVGRRAEAVQRHYPWRRLNCPVVWRGRRPNFQHFKWYVLLVESIQLKNSS